MVDSELIKELEAIENGYAQAAARRIRDLERASRNMIVVLSDLKSFFKSTGYAWRSSPKFDPQLAGLAGKVHAVVRRYSGWPGAKNDLFGGNFEDRKPPIKTAGG